MLYNHCASGILEASKKDPALTDLRFLQLSAGHSQTNLSGVFCLSFKTICVLHAHSRRDASKLPSDYIANANSTLDVFYDLTDTLPWWKATAQDLPCWATAVQKMVLFQPSSAAAKRVFSLLVTMFGDQQHEGLEGGKIILRHPLCYVSVVRQLLPLKRMDFVLVRRMPGR